MSDDPDEVRGPNGAQPPAPGQGRRRQSFGALIRRSARGLRRLLVVHSDIVRIVIAALTFAMVAWRINHLVAAADGWSLGVVAGWDTGVAVYLLLNATFIRSATPARARHWAIAQDSPRSRLLQTFVGRTVGLGFIVFVSLAGLAAATGLLPSTDNPEAPGNELLRTLSAIAVIEAWLLLQMAYGLHYAYRYYRNAGGLVFPGGEDPDLLDFMYFSFTFGTAFATSDVQVTSRPIRRAVLGHTILSFFYNAAILAIAFKFLTGG